MRSREPNRGLPWRCHLIVKTYSSVVDGIRRNINPSKELARPDIFCGAVAYISPRRTKAGWRAAHGVPAGTAGEIFRQGTRRNYCSIREEGTVSTLFNLRSIQMVGKRWLWIFRITRKSEAVKARRDRYPMYLYILRGMREHTFHKRYHIGPESPIACGSRNISGNQDGLSVPCNPIKSQGVIPRHREEPLSKPLTWGEK